jgi:hypothetical protein
VVIDERGPHPVEPRAAGQAGHRHPDIGRVIQQDRGDVGMLADLLPQRRHRPIHRARGEGDGDLAVVPNPGRDGIASGPLGQQHDLDGDVTALADQLLDQPRQLGNESVVGLDLRRGALALMEEGVRLINDHHDQRPGRGGAELPGVGHAQDLGDAGLAVQHQPVDLPEHIPHLGEVVFCG